MDQGAFSLQGVSGHQRERGEDAVLECALHLLAIAIVKKLMHLMHSLYEILKVLSLAMFSTPLINQLLTPSNADLERGIESKQLALL